MDYVTLVLVVGGLTLFVAKFAYMAKKGGRAAAPSNRRLVRDADFGPHIGSLDDVWMRINPTTGLPMATQSLDVEGNPFGSNPDVTFPHDSSCDTDLDNGFHVIGDTSGTTDHF